MENPLYWISMIEKVGNAISLKISSIGYLLGYMGRVFKTSFFFVTREKAARKIFISCSFYIIPSIILSTIIFSSANNIQLRWKLKSCSMQLQSWSILLSVILITKYIVLSTLRFTLLLELNIQLTFDTSLYH